jgi:hypothetical protein
VRRLLLAPRRRRRVTLFPAPSRRAGRRRPWWLLLLLLLQWGRWRWLTDGGVRGGERRGGPGPFLTLRPSRSRGRSSAPSLARRPEPSAADPEPAVADAEARVPEVSRTGGRLCQRLVRAFPLPPPASRWSVVSWPLAPPRAPRPGPPHPAPGPRPCV